jgi:hypothetical protein
MTHYDGRERGAQRNDGSLIPFLFPMNICT